MVCARCGTETLNAESYAGGFDEESGEFLCGFCLKEMESCGCADDTLVHEDEE